MREKSFGEWVHYFITLNLVLLTVLMLIMPVYPWWFFAVAAVIVKFFVPHFINLKTNGKGKKSGFRTFK